MKAKSAVSIYLCKTGIRDPDRRKTGPLITAQAKPENHLKRKKACENEDKHPEKTPAQSSSLQA